MIVLFAAFYTIAAVVSRCKDSKPMMNLVKMLSVLICLQVIFGLVVVDQRAEEGSLSFQKTAILGANRKITVPHNRSATATAHVLIGALILVVAASLRAHAIGPNSGKNGGAKPS